MKKEDIPELAKTETSDKMEELHRALLDIQMKNKQIEQGLTESLTCENPKILEILMEHIVLHWDDIVQMLLDELIHEEVQELNQIELKSTEGEREPPKTKLADRSLYGKYHDYKSVDLHDIMSLFDEYLTAEKSIKNKL